MNTLRRKILIISILVSLGFVTGCMTVQGAAADIGDVSRFVERSLGPVAEKRKQAQLEQAAQLVIRNKK